MRDRTRKIDFMANLVKMLPIMRWNQLFIPTKREDPREAEVVSHKIMLRSGMIMKVSSGIYTYMPVGLKVIRKVENIVREEMDKAGAIELIMPLVIPKELWEETERWEYYGKELLRFQDRNQRWFCLGPTHEEVITDLVRREIRSYRDLPKNFYQIHTKFRDEVRPRFGIMRAREFIMKDAYSFDADEKGVERSYTLMYETYVKIFQRCGLRMKVVEAETGTIGGSFSHEFMVLADTGEDILFTCETCGYSANREKAECVPIEKVKEGSLKSKEIVLTPETRSVEEVAEFLGVPIVKIIKTLLYLVDSTPVLVLLRGDMEANETKIKNYITGKEIRLATDDEVLSVTGTSKGFIGPVGLNIRTLVDYSVLTVEDGVCGANRDDYHFIHIVPGRDFALKEVGDFRFAVEGDMCPRCGKGALMSSKGIEVGHTFKLGTKYSKAMNATYLDRDGNEKLIIMGCYGIGIGRTAAAAIEQNHDEKGAIFPISIAPFEVAVIPVNVYESAQKETAEKIYNRLLSEKIDVIIDDRDERAGVKFNDIDLLGIPLKVISGKKAKEHKVELKDRKGEKIMEVDIDNAVRVIKTRIEEMKGECQG